MLFDHIYMVDTDSGVLQKHMGVTYNITNIKPYCGFTCTFMYGDI